MMIAAVSDGAVWEARRWRSVANDASTRSSRDPVPSERGNGATNTPAGSGLWPARYTVFDVVIAIVKWVRPWNDPSNTITLDRPVACLASLTAASVASAPEFEKKKVSIDDGVIRSRACANSSNSGCS